jgi:hypothetical protein
MIRKAFRVVGVILLIMLLGASVYAKNGMMAKVDRKLTPNPNQALIVFMRSSFAGSAISASLYDVSKDDNKFIGIMYNGTKVCYDVDPGEYIFMVAGESVDFMKATVSAGKTYFALVTPRMGAWRARFSFKPLRQSDLTGSEFSKCDSKTYVVAITPEAEEWAKGYASDIAEMRASSWPEWLALTPEEKDSMTLRAEDGR